MIWLNMFDIIGTMVFAISGALAGIRKKLDLFGIITLSIVTACGGGFFRDIVIGNLTPTIFRDPKYFVISIITSVFTFFLYPVLIKFQINSPIKNKLTVFLIFDAIGLGAFTAIGANIAITHNMTNLFSVTCMGMLTGVGGGVLRDMFVRDIPLILKQEIYASASAVGAMAMYFSYGHVPQIASLYISFFVTLILRLLSLKFNLNLPTINIDTIHKKNTPKEYTNI